MEGVILTLCLSLTFVLLGVIVCGGMRLRENYLQYLSEFNDGKSAPRTILVKQNAGELKIVYSIEPQEKFFERDLAREIAVIRAAQENQIFLHDGEDMKESTQTFDQAKAPTQGDENLRAEAPKEEKESSSDGEVLIHRGEKLNFSRRYELLSENERSLFDEFCRYVEAVPFCERKMQANCLVYRYKKETIVKVGIRRGIAVLEFHILNPDLGRMLREERLKGMKVQPAKINLTSESDLALAVKTADLTVTFLKNEEAYKRDRRKAARREAERKKRAEGGNMQ